MDRTAQIGDVVRTPDSWFGVVMSQKGVFSRVWVEPFGLKSWPSRDLRVIAILDDREFQQLEREFSEGPHERISEDLGEGGYRNRFGVWVPNPFGELDSKGRDLDKVGRNLRPGEYLTDETIDRILADPESI